MKFPVAEQERLPYGYDAPFGDVIAAIVARCERLRGQVSEAMSQTELLFQSLLSEAFTN